MKYNILRAEFKGNKEFSGKVFDRYELELQGFEHPVSLMQMKGAPQPSGEMDLEISKKEFDGNIFYNAKKVRPAFGGMRGDGNKDRQVALQCACMVEKNQDLVLEVAEWFLKWIKGEVNNSNNNNKEE